MSGRSSRMRGGIRMATALGALSLLSACAGGSSEGAAEARCREQGLSPGSLAYAQCAHPDHAAELERAQEAWDDAIGE